jgi:predicted O-methyltransferase YrrM
MKKSELRHRIREIIREQRDDLEKNKLRSTRDEEPPMGQTPNAHDSINVMVKCVTPKPMLEKYSY